MVTPGSSPAVLVGLLWAEPMMISVPGLESSVLWNAELKAMCFVRKEGPDLFDY